MNSAVKSTGSEVPAGWQVPARWQLSITISAGFRK